MFRPGWKTRGDNGASGIEYAALLVLAGFVLGILYVAIPDPVRVHTKAAICEIIHAGDQETCKVTTGANGEKTVKLLRHLTPDGGCQAFCPTEGNPIHPSDPVTSATKGNYVALGDSYASGEGANGYWGKYLGNSGADKCHRAPAAFTEGLSKQYTFKGGTRFVACSGATTTDLTNGRYGEKPQLDALDPHTTTVTLSVGGDDMDFLNVMTACMEDPHFSWPWNWPLFGGHMPEDQCHAQQKNISARMQHLFGQPPGGGPSRYQQMLEKIHQKAPNARILVSGYPHLFPVPPNKAYLGNLRKSDQTFLNQKAHDLNTAIAQQVQQEDKKWYGSGQQKMGSFEYVDDWDALKGHEVTTDDPWINAVQPCGTGTVHPHISPNCPGPKPLTGTGSFHPNVQGQQSYQRAYARQLSEGPGRVLYDP